MKKVTVEDLPKIFISPGLAANKATTKEFRMWLQNKIKRAFDYTIKENPEIEDTMEGRAETINQLIEQGIEVSIVGK